MLLIITLLYLGFTFWDFPIADIYLGELPIHPLIGIILKSLLIIPLYLLLIYKLNISPEINGIFKRFYK